MLAINFRYLLFGCRLHTIKLTPAFLKRLVYDYQDENPPHRPASCQDAPRKDALSNQVHERKPGIVFWTCVDMIRSDTDFLCCFRMTYRVTCKIKRKE